MSAAILPIGSVNLRTGKNAAFGNLFSLWTESAEASNTLFRSGEKFYAVHSAGYFDEKPGTVVEFRHDQTGRKMKRAWTVVEVFPHTMAGINRMAEVTGKNWVTFATYK